MVGIKKGKGKLHFKFNILYFKSFQLDSKVSYCLYIYIYIYKVELLQIKPIIWFSLKLNFKLIEKYQGHTHSHI